MIGDRRRPSRSSRIFAALAFANLTYAVAQTLLIPSIPGIERHVHASPVGATALASVFFLSGAATAGLIGRLGDVIGKQRIVSVQLALFTLGALICALGNNLQILIAGRAVMGLAAALFPLSASIVRDELPDRWVANGIAFLGATIGVGAAIGLAGGGLVADHLNYHWIFWIPLLMGAASTAGVVVFVPESSIKSPGRIDLVGGLLLGLGLAGPLVAISRTPDWGWAGSKTLFLLGLGLVFLVLFVLHERRHPSPLLDIRVLMRAEVALTNAATFLVGFGMFGASFIITQFLQEPTSTGYGFGATAVQASLFVMPGTILLLITAPVSGLISSRAGPKRTLLAGAALGTVALGLLSAFHGSRIELYLWPAISAIDVGFALAAMPMLILDAVPLTHRGQSTATNQIFRLVGSSIGIQLAATFIAGSIGRTRLPAESGFTSAFVVEAASALGAFLLAITIPARRTQRVSATDPAAVEGVAPAADLS
jgi:MFS family permease